MTTFGEVRAADLRFRESLGSASNPVQVVRESLKRCLAAALLLTDRLASEGLKVSVGKQFERKEGGALDSHVGLSVPLILELFWEVIGEIRFANLESLDHLTGWTGAQWVGGDVITDALEVLVPRSEEGRLLAELFSDPVTRAAQWFPFSADALHRDGISGGGPLGVKKVHGSFVPVVSNFESLHGGEENIGCVSSIRSTEATDMISYLRWSLLYGAGFPGIFRDGDAEPFRRKMTLGLGVF